MGLKPTSREEHSITRDGSLDRRRDLDQTGNDDRQKPVQNGSLDSSKAQAAKKISNPRNGDLDRTRTASSKKVESKPITGIRSGSLDDTRGGPETTRGGPLEDLRNGSQTTRDGSLDSTRTAEPKKTKKKIRRVA